MPRKIPVWKPPEIYNQLKPNGLTGNEVNGYGEPEARRPTPFFWHEPKYQQFGDLQGYVLGRFFGHGASAPVAEAFHITPEGQYLQRGPEPVPQADVVAQKTAQEWTEEVKNFVPHNDGDIAGIAEMQPEWVYEGFEVRGKYVIVIGVAHDYEMIRHAPSEPGGDQRAAIEVGNQYTRGAVAGAKLANFILSQGYYAYSYPGPSPTSLSIMPAALAAGLGELGKHGSIINRELGASFRLAAVVTDMPLEVDTPDEFGADEFCQSCQICTDQCPPAAITDHKHMVRGVEKWYVDFDKCIPYFGETMGCAICIAVCPWSRPGVGDNLVKKMARKRAEAG